MGKCEISIWQPGILAQRILVDTTGKNTQKIAEYIRNQLKENAEKSQLTMDFDPFTASW